MRRRRAAEPATAPATTSAITTGDTATLVLATAMIATHRRSHAGPDTSGKGQTRRDETATTIPRWSDRDRDVREQGLIEVTRAWVMRSD